jgi:type II secretory pathway pseudopilin PulG
MINLKKGAMFGLDARIALAIFGALSVISGAALYSAIGQSKATAFVTDMNEIGKAWEQYTLDVGHEMSQYDAYTLHTGNLVENQDSAINWKGPYLSYGVDSTDTNFLSHPDYRRIYLLKITNEETWGGSTSWSAGGECTAGKKCFLWVVVNGIDTNARALEMDKLVDNGDGESKGKLRWTDDGGLGKISYYLQYAPVKNPND